MMEESTYRRPVTVQRAGSTSVTWPFVLEASGRVIRWSRTGIPARWSTDKWAGICPRSGSWQSSLAIVPQEGRSLFPVVIFICGQSVLADAIVAPMGAAIQGWMAIRIQSDTRLMLSQRAMNRCFLPEKRIIAIITRLNKIDTEHPIWSSWTHKCCLSSNIPLF